MTNKVDYIHLYSFRAKSVVKGCKGNYKSNKLFGANTTFNFSTKIP